MLKKNKVFLCPGNEEQRITTGFWKWYIIQIIHSQKKIEPLQDTNENHLPATSSEHQCKMIRHFSLTKNDALTPRKPKIGPFIQSTSSIIRAAKHREHKDIWYKSQPHLSNRHKRRGPGGGGKAVALAGAGGERVKSKEGRKWIDCPSRPETLIESTMSVRISLSSN